MELNRLQELIEKAHTMFGERDEALLPQTCIEVMQLRERQEAGLSHDEAQVVLDAIKDGIKGRLLARITGYDIEEYDLAAKSVVISVVHMLKEDPMAAGVASLLLKLNKEVQDVQ